MKKSLNRATMTPDQLECWELVCDWQFGEHHGPRYVYEWGKGIKFSMYDGLSTFDFDYLTRLVFLAHDRCIRAEIIASSPGRVGIVLHKRHTRDGGIAARHPTAEQALAAHRIKNPATA